MINRSKSEKTAGHYALTNAAGRGVSVSLSYDGSYVTNMVYVLPNGNTFAVGLTRKASRKYLVARRDYSFNGSPTYWYSTDYDLLNRPTNATDSVSLVREWLYNRRSELAAASIGTNRYGYAYDTIGNRLWAADNLATNTYAANNLNQYSSILRDSASPREPTYDADGNLTFDGVFTYAYDAENRLVSVASAVETNGAIRVLNAYDHVNRRIRKTVQKLSVTVASPPSPLVETREWQTVATHTFVWDGNNIVLERIARADGTAHVCEYFWGMDKSGTEQGAGGVEGLLAVSVDGVFYIPCYDHNGNIVRYVSETGTITVQYTYDPYGNVTETYGDLADMFSFGFSTKYHDREIGMIGYQRRFYCPDLGRWLNRDPIEEDGGENLYAFCDNAMPYKYDALGTKTCCRNGEKISCDDSFKWAGNVTVASVTRFFGVTFLMVDLVSNYICNKCTRYRLHAKAVLPTISAGAPVSLTGSEVEFGDVSPDVFAGSVMYGAVGIGAMGVVEASYLRLGDATAKSFGLVGGAEVGAGGAYGWYVDFELIEE